MTREEIYQLIADAKTALLPPQTDLEKTKRYPSRLAAATVQTAVSEKADQQYQKYAKLLFSFQEIKDENKKKISKDIDFCINADVVKCNVKSAGTKATLRKYARSVRHVAIHELHRLLKLVEGAQRAGDWEKVGVIATDPSFKTLTELSKTMPIDYFEGWKPAEKYIRKDKNGDLKRNKNGEVIKPLDRPNSKKRSLGKLPKDWRELMAETSTGQYRIPMIVALLTGCRPEELVNGVLLAKIKEGLYVRIKGVKVGENAGQEYRAFKLANHPLTTELLDMMNNMNKIKIKVIVKNGNSVTTHMRNTAEKIWPKRVQSVTLYTARHGMAADCKSAIVNGADPDLVSKVLGHCVDKTASFYGNRFQGGGIDVVPSDVHATRQVRHKSKDRNEKRRANNKVPSRKSKIKLQPAF